MQTRHSLLPQDGGGSMQKRDLLIANLAGKNVQGCTFLTNALFQWLKINLRCRNNSHPYTDVTSRNSIKENDSLRFEATLPDGKIVENW